MAELTPMMQQYRTVKERNPDCSLFFRLGDFYEMFDEDARIASRELDLTLTSRDHAKDKAPEDKVPMCGVPFHSSESYIARLVQKGYKVAICEQMEDPALAKGLVKRDIIRIVTPGTVTESSMLDESKNDRRVQRNRLLRPRRGGGRMQRARKLQPDRAPARRRRGNVRRDQSRRIRPPWLLHGQEPGAPV